ncbi:uncharacterized protein MONBRDRAFT_36628 [Monosiga brevicollis MX1]|uniref:Uncharacterized protein n=1 Tax=Monosiga brevicollis TaxID=81824 RepID=A9UWH1_MONBE|nr:uncharacterized protein MONBRDRAFT_36628 [Monosiga brevicollis MX1]EDQ90211.1 predicted protein [Monosiga brevicollis MX1]|eukprot:XP_001744978.1 hypothetical protein [Monosiga brevicollis MX1]
MFRSASLATGGMICDSSRPRYTAPMLKLNPTQYNATICSKLTRPGSTTSCPAVSGSSTSHRTSSAAMVSSDKGLVDQRAQGLQFVVESSRFDEKSLDKASYPTVQAFVEDNAMHKAREVASRLGRQADIIIAADTVIHLPSGQIMEKPVDAADATAMMRSHSGASHQVTSGVALGVRGPDDHYEFSTFHETATVTFAKLSEDEIAAYVATGDGMDKAGGYGIQSTAAVLIESIQGDYYTIVGLPVHQLSHRLANVVSTRSDV